LYLLIAGLAGLIAGLASPLAAAAVVEIDVSDRLASPVIAHLYSMAELETMTPGCLPVHQERK
jgi:hypothetical protein